MQGAVFVELRLARQFTSKRRRDVPGVDAQASSDCVSLIVTRIA